jgi:hypothetical protein
MEEPPEKRAVLKTPAIPAVVAESVYRTITCRLTGTPARSAGFAIAANRIDVPPELRFVKHKQHDQKQNERNHHRITRIG